MSATARLLAAYGATLAAFLALDAVWLKYVAAGMYQRGIGHLLAEKVNFVAAGCFYLLYPVALMVFAVLPAAGHGWPRSALLGGVLGLTAYATYELTNLATLKGWPVGLSLADMAWGTVASAAAALVGFALHQSLQR
jgi:uncharacterized membrane protein